MATSYVGKAAYHGIATTATGTNLGTIYIQNIELVPVAIMNPIDNGSGQTLGFAIANQSQSLQIEGIFVGTGIGDAKTQMAKTPAKGDVITIADADDSETVGAHTGAYVVMESSKRKVKDNIASMTMRIIQFTDNDVSGTVSA